MSEKVHCSLYAHTCSACVCKLSSTCMPLSALRVRATDWLCTSVCVLLDNSMNRRLDIVYAILVYVYTAQCLYVQLSVHTHAGLCTLQCSSIQRNSSHVDIGIACRCVCKLNNMQLILGMCAYIYIAHTDHTRVSSCVGVNKRLQTMYTL
jgi:hypothetical protein